MSQSGRLQPVAWKIGCTSALDPKLPATSVRFQEAELDQSLQAMIGPINSALWHVDLMYLSVRHVAGNNRSMQMI